jgi:putative transposase
LPGTVVALDRLVAVRGCAPEFIRCDNGPELTANALKDWCRFSHTGTAYIGPGSPWQNPYVESFNSRVREMLEEATIDLADLTATFRQDSGAKAH